MNRSDHFEIILVTSFTARHGSALIARSEYENFENYENQSFSSPINDLIYAAYSFGILFKIIICEHTN